MSDSDNKIENSSDQRTHSISGPLSDREPAQSSRLTFGSFYVSESEFALEVAQVREVVNPPANYTVVPLAPAYLKGLFNLRGTVIPVVDLCELLRLQSGSCTDTRKIAVIEREGCCIGLLVDKTGEVFKSHEDERSDFDSDHSSGVIRGVFKKDFGKRVIQILDVTKLFKLQNVPKDTSHYRSGREGLERKRGKRKQCISFVVGPAKCSLGISDIQEILKIDNLSDSALGVGNCIGTIDLRGSTVPVVDFPALLNYREVDRSALAPQGDRRIVVMRLGQELFGLMVDSIDSIISYFPDELLAFPLVEQKRSEMFLGCITGHGDPDILLLDHQRILDHSEISEITHGHSKIYRAQSESKVEANLKRGERKTYITFQIDGSYAVAINEVKEIIDYPKHLLKPPGMKEHVHGLLNLRGTLVMIIDSRSLYSRSPTPVSGNLKKIIVFQRNGAHFGLIVDSVESIVTFSESDQVRLPAILYSEGENSLSSDVSEAVEFTDSSGVRRSLLILSADSLAARAAKSLAA